MDQRYIAVVLIACIAGAAVYFYPKPPVPPDGDGDGDGDGGGAYHTFTWFSCPVTVELASWAQSEHFTDVALRLYMMDNLFGHQSVVESFSTLSKVGITGWSVICSEDYPSTSDYSGMLRNWISHTPNGHILLDDSSVIVARGDSAYNAFLNAVRSVQTVGDESNIIVEAPWLPTQSPYNSYSRFDWSGIDVDFYNYPESDYSSMPGVNAASVGGFFWAWPSGWESYSSSMISGVYARAKSLGFKRMTAWTGYEPNFQQYYPGYSQSQSDGCALYLHPTAAALIKNLNIAFLE